MSNNYVVRLTGGQIKALMTAVANVTAGEMTEEEGWTNATCAALRRAAIRLEAARSGHPDPFSKAAR